MTTVHEDILDNTLNEKLTASILENEGQIGDDLLTLCYLSKIAKSLDHLSKSIFEMGLSLQRRH